MARSLIAGHKVSLQNNYIGLYRAHAAVAFLWIAARPARNTSNTTR